MEALKECEERKSNLNATQFNWFQICYEGWWEIIRYNKFRLKTKQTIFLGCCSFLKFSIVNQICEKQTSENIYSAFLVEASMFIKLNWCFFCLSRALNSHKNSFTLKNDKMIQQK
jgi:hypothetical protein